MDPSPDKPVDALAKLSKMNTTKSHKYSVVMYYINRDLIDMDNPTQPFGLVIPCGEYKTLEQADRIRDEISLKTGATYVATCRNNCAMPIGPSDNRGTIKYMKDLDADMATVQESLDRAKEEYKRVQKRKEIEVDERSDPTTISYLIQKLYQISNAKKMEGVFLNQLKVARSIIDESEDKVLEFFRNDPSALNIWKAESESRFKERGEMHVHNAILEVYDELIGSHSLEEFTIGKRTVSGNITVETSEIKLTNSFDKLPIE